MANEATINMSLTINKAPLQFLSRPGQFRADVAVGKGPTPGAFTVTAAGVDADLSQLDTPGLCWIQNLDDTEIVEWGIWDGATFFGVGRLLPTEMALFRLSEEFSVGTSTNNLRFVSQGADCFVSVLGFES